MMELFDTTLNESDELLSENELITVFKNYQIIVPSIADKISSKVINEQMKICHLLQILVQAQII